MGVISPQAVGVLTDSGHKYQRELVNIPVLEARKHTLKYMTGRRHVAGKLTYAEMTGNLELGPYDADRTNDSGVKYEPRTLETFLGNCKYTFDPNQVSGTIFGDDDKIVGKALLDAQAAKDIHTYLCKRLGAKLNAHIFNAVRNEHGTKTSELFNGLDEIARKEIAAGNIAAVKNNYLKISEAISNVNAVDQLRLLGDSISDELDEAIGLKMWLPKDIYKMYLQDYQSTVGAVPYNQQYKKTFLECSNQNIELLPLASKKGSKYIQITTQDNMLYGYGGGLADETAVIEKFDSFKLTFAAAMWFGVEYLSIAPERMFIGEITRPEAA